MWVCVCVPPLPLLLVCYVLFWLLGYEIAVNQWIITQWPNQRSAYQSPHIYFLEREKKRERSFFGGLSLLQGILAVKAQMSSRSGWHFYEDWWVPSMGYVRNLNVFWLTVACIQMACFSLSHLKLSFCSLHFFFFLLPSTKCFCWEKEKRESWCEMLFFS